MLCLDWKPSFLLLPRFIERILIQNNIKLEGGVLSVDDTVIEKHYSAPNHTEIIGNFWFGKHHKTMIGLNLITLYYSAPDGNSVSLNYRIYDRKKQKTKNEYFREMLAEIIDWGVRPRIVTGDSWYSGVENLKFLKNQKLGFLFGIKKNRTVSSEPQNYCAVNILEIPDKGLMTHLKGFGFIKLLRKDFKKEDSRYYILYLPDVEKLQETEVNLSLFTLFIEALKPFIESSNNCVESLGLW